MNSEGRIRAQVSSRKSHQGSQKEGRDPREELKEPSGVKVKDSSHRNMERGEACNIDVSKLRSSQGESSPKKVKKENDNKVTLGLALDQNLKKTPEDEKFYEKKAKQIQMFNTPEAKKEEEEVIRKKEQSVEKPLDDSEKAESPPKEDSKLEEIKQQLSPEGVQPSGLPPKKLTTIRVSTKITSIPFWKKLPKAPSKFFRFSAS